MKTMIFVARLLLAGCTIAPPATQTVYVPVYKPA